MSAVPVYCQCGKKLHTKHCLAELFGCEPRAVVRMAALGRWRSTRVPVLAGGRSAPYLFTDEMIAEIIRDGEQQARETLAAQKPQQKPMQTHQPKPRRTRQPAPIAGSNVRPLVAKQPRRSA